MNLQKSIVAGFAKSIAEIDVAFIAKNEEVSIVSESAWQIQDDHSELKKLIGKATDGSYLFGYIDDLPEAEIHWQGGSFSSPEAALKGRYDYEATMNEKALENQEGIVGEYCQLWDSPHITDSQRESMLPF